ncbi:MAG: DUF4760 domain-containing protein [Blastocatellia bacterium]
MDISSLINSVAALGALLAAVAALYQAKKLSSSISVDSSLKLDDRFGSLEFRCQRAAAAHYLLKKTANDEALSEVLDFFDTLGYLVKIRAIDKRLVWNVFFFVVQGYWHTAKEHIQRNRRDDPTIWQNLHDLYNTLVKIEKEERGKTGSDSDVVLSQYALSQFLEAEANLAREPNAAMSLLPKLAQYKHGLETEGTSESGKNG